MSGPPDRGRSGTSTTVVSTTLLKVEDLRCYYNLQSRWVRAVDGVSFSLSPGETLGVVGESGCGKSTLGLTLLRILPRNARVMGGKVLLDGTDLLSVSDREMRVVRWKEISMIFQGAMNSLNPVLRIRDMLHEALRAHEDLSPAAARDRITQTLELAGFPPDRISSYPHELSGGMKQRAIIALSLVCRPRIVVADEPTTALDVVVQGHILRRLKTIQREMYLALILITHDIAVVAQLCDRVAIMYGGQIFEYAPVRRIFKDSRNPYTIGLMSSVPSLVGPVRTLVSIPGRPTDLQFPPIGCRFVSRCALAAPICSSAPPPLVQVSPDHWSRCHFATDDRVVRLRQTPFISPVSA